MRTECTEILWKASDTVLPGAGSFPAFYPSPEHALQKYPGLVPALENLGGDQLSTVFGYGSSFNGESPDSWLDFLVVVQDAAQFHRQNQTRHPKDYSPPFGWRFESWLQRFSPNYKYSEISLEEGNKRIKCGVLDVDNFLTQARAGLRHRGGLAHLYTAGRLQKAILIPFILDEDPARRSQIDTAINQARIDGVWLAMGLLPEYFDYKALLRTYVGLSYAADIRVEKANKVDLLIEQSQQEYARMMEGLLGAFVKSDILEDLGEGVYGKKFTLGEREVRDWIRESALYSAGINYVKNPLTCGVGNAVDYAISKIKRANRHQSLSSSETRNSGLRAKLAFLPEAAAKVIHKEIPDLSPNMVTGASAVATAVVALMAERRNRTGETGFKGSRAELAMLVIAQALDFFDGSLAREINKIGDKNHDSRWGGLYDALNDRWGAGAMGISRIISAHKRNDLYGEIVATAATLTNPWPSVLRATGEVRGETFPESGKNVLEFFGTHAGRTALAIPATLYPNMFHFQKVADTISALANILTITKRAKGGNVLELPQEKLDTIKAEAGFRGKGLFLAALGTGTAVLGTHAFLHRKK